MSSSAIAQSVRYIDCRDSISLIKSDCHKGKQALRGGFLGVSLFFTLSGFLVFLSQMFLYMAMSVAPVTVVSPINRLSILFRLYFSRWLNPKHEVLGSSVIAGTVVSILGAVALSMSTEVVQSIVPLPDGVIALLNWHWP